MLRFISYGILIFATAKGQAYYVGDSLVQEGVHAFYNYNFDKCIVASNNNVHQDFLKIIKNS